MKFLFRIFGYFFCYCVKESSVLFTQLFNAFYTFNLLNDQQGLLLADWLNIRCQNSIIVFVLIARSCGQGMFIKVSPSGIITCWLG